jgi:phosphoserine phosphatase RsbU/P
LGENNEIFFSAVVGVINNNYISYSNAGHFPPLVINPDSGIYSILSGSNMLAGIDRNTVYDLRMAPVNNGDCIILYTDGLFENYTESSYSGWERVNEYCITHSELIKTSPNKLLDDLVTEFSELSSSNCKDDITLMLICLK